MTTTETTDRIIRLAREVGSTATTHAGAMRYMVARPVPRAPIPDAEGMYAVQQRRCDTDIADWDGENARDAVRRQHWSTRMEARAASQCRERGLWTLEDALAEARERDIPIQRAISRAIAGRTSYRRSRSCWVGGEHRTWVFLAHDGHGHCSGESQRVWHRRHHWSGTDSSHSFYITRRTLHTLGVDRIVIGGLVTLDYSQPDATGVARARWAVQSTGVSLRTETGYIVRGRYHVVWRGQDTPAARRRALREYAQSVQRRRAAATQRHVAERLAHGDADGFAGLVVRRDDSIAAGNCGSGTDSWIAAHLPGRREATVQEILATGDRRPEVLRAVMVAIRRAQHESVTQTA